ncbi:protein YfiH-like superfamily [Candidatus Termititenax persephonae]|uniref:Protein YfiH-like superfamily n=1 Tax=Candidatus Termititenax persephonae TaxID=2218525 RepID=A0A388TGW3_9BACT|nr:protein YfiH-like superfamily [Candidatus Termititenax persephonae]
MRYGFVGRGETLPPGRAVFAQQIHQDKIGDVETADAERREIAGCDALATRQKNLLLVVKTADCAPLLFYDAVTETIAAVHAGRAGTELGLAGKTVAHLVRRYAVEPANLRVIMGPAICVHCYQIDRDRDRHYDLWAENKKQLTAAGVQNIENTGLCTACHAHDRFYSYRRERTALRNFAYIALEPL